MLQHLNAPRLAALFVALLFTPAAHAQTYTWQGGGGNNSWGTAGNWLGGIAPPSDLGNTNLVFGATSFGFPSISGAFDVRTLTFSAGAGGYVFDSGPLTIGAGGINQNAVAAQAFSAAVVLGADQTWSLAAGGGAFTFGGGLNTTGGPGNAARALTINAATTTGGGNIVNGVIAGGGSLTKTGAGVLTLTGANTYSGGTTLAAGTLGLAGDSALGGGALTVSGNGSLFAAAADITLANPIILGGGTTLTLAADPAGVRNLTVKSPVAGAGGLTVHVPGGTVTLSGMTSNSFGGPTSVTAGTLVLAKPFAVRAVGGTLSVGNAVAPGAAGSAVVLLTAGYQTSFNNAMQVHPDGLFNLGNKEAPVGPLTMTGGEIRIGTGSLILGADVTAGGGAKVTAATFSNNINLNAAGHTFLVADGAAAYDLDVQAGFNNGALKKSGAGTLRLAGVTNVAFAVTLTAGTLALASDTAFGTGLVTLSGGTLVGDGGDRTLGNPVNVGGGVTVGASVDGTPRAVTLAGTLTLTGDATFTVDNTAATTFGAVALGANTLTIQGTGPLSITGSIGGTGGLTVAAPGNTVTLGGSPPLLYTGATTITAGTLLLAKTGSAVRGDVVIGNATGPAPPAASWCGRGHRTSSPRARRSPSTPTANWT